MFVKNPILQENKKKGKLCRETDLCRALLIVSIITFHRGEKGQQETSGNQPHVWTQSCHPLSRGSYGLVEALSH